MVPQRLLDALREKKNKVFLVSSHINLEGDALGSELALASLLRRLGKKVLILNQDKPPEEYGFLPGVEAILHDDSPRDYDAAILVDCSDIKRIGRCAKALQAKRALINIDHHSSNSRFGDINWVQSRASSASEMVYLLFQALKFKIRRPEALCLYTGLVVDTGWFKYSSTSALTHRIAAELLKYRFDVYRIYRGLYESMSFGAIKAFAGIISTLTLDASGKIAWLEVANRLIRKEPVLAEYTDALIQFARSIKGTEVALLFKETKRGKEVRVSLRSAGRLDVNAVAGVFGGGGHKAAASCTIRGRALKEAVVLVTAQVKKEWVKKHEKRHSYCR